MENISFEDTILVRFMFTQYCQYYNSGGNSFANRTWGLNLLMFTIFPGRGDRRNWKESFPLRHSIFVKVALHNELISDLQIFIIFKCKWSPNDIFKFSIVPRNRLTGFCEICEYRGPRFHRFVFWIIYREVGEIIIPEDIQKLIVMDNTWMNRKDISLLFRPG